MIGSYTLHHGDCLDVMAKMETGSVDLVFTSPPYNLGTSSGGGLQSITNKTGKWSGGPLAGGYEGHDDAMPHAEYVAWQQKVLLECWRVLKDDGAIYYNHKPRVQHGLLVSPLELNPGLPLRQIIIWKRAGGVNFSPTFYLPTHEWIMLLAKPAFRLRDKEASGAKDVWEVRQEQGNPHPAPFPAALPRIALETTTARVILDPFMGSGSTGVACIECGCHFIGIEQNRAYYTMAQDRLDAAYTERENDPFLFA